MAGQPTGRSFARSLRDLGTMPAIALAVILIVLTAEFTRASSAPGSPKNISSLIHLRATIDYLRAISFVRTVDASLSPATTTSFTPFSSILS